MTQDIEASQSAPATADAAGVDASAAADHQPESDIASDMAAEDWFSPEAATFGDRLAAAREQAGMSQAQLARRLGVKASTLRSWEEDLSEPRANRLSMLAGILNVSIMWLMNGEGEGLEAPLDEASVSSDVAGMLQELRELRLVIAQSGETLGRLEKRLRLVLKDQA